MQRVTLRVKTDAEGAATIYGPNHCRGLVDRVKFDPGTMEGTPTLTLTGSVGGETIWVQTASLTATTARPRATVQTSAQVDVTYDGTRKIYEKYAVVDEQLKLVVSGGGNAKAGTVEVTLI